MAAGYTNCSTNAGNLAGLHTSAYFSQLVTHVASGKAALLSMGNIYTGCDSDYWSNTGGHYVLVGNIKYIIFTNIPWFNNIIGCFMFKVDEIQLGSTGVDVLLCQEILKARGFYTGTLDWSYGNGTQSAVAAYQQSRVNAGAQLTVDGVCGPATWSDMIGKDPL